MDELYILGRDGMKYIDKLLWKNEVGKKGNLSKQRKMY